MQAGFEAALISAAAREREVELTTLGRRSGRPIRTTLWCYTDGSRICIRSGAGMASDWPRNLDAAQHGMLRIAGIEVPVRARRVLDVGEARQIGALCVAKYPDAWPPSADGEPPRPFELATFVLTPDQQGE